MSRILDWRPAVVGGQRVGWCAEDLANDYQFSVRETEGRAGLFTATVYDVGAAHGEAFVTIGTGYPSLELAKRACRDWVPTRAEIGGAG